MADNQGGSEDAPPLARGNSRAKQRLSILQWNCRSITGKVPFLLDYMQIHQQVDVLMLQSLNVQARALPQLDGYYYPPVPSAYLIREVTDRPPWSMFTTLLGAARPLRLLGSKTSTLRRAVGWWLAISTSATDCGMLLLLIRVACTWQTQPLTLTLLCSTMGQSRELAKQGSAALPLTSRW